MNVLLLSIILVKVALATAGKIPGTNSEHINKVDSKVQSRESPKVDGPKRAFFSFVEDIESIYAKGAIALGYSIKKNSGYFPSKSKPAMVLMTLTDLKYRSNSQRALEKIGWTVKTVNRIKPFKEGYSQVYKNQYTKLNLWNFTEWDSILYMDSDTLVKESICGVFELTEVPGPWGLLAVKDPSKDVAMPFNAGVMGIKPDALVFADMLEKGPKIDYKPVYAEQSFLNAYFKDNYLGLPLTYNFNSWWDCRGENLKYRENMWRHVRIVHFIRYKPFSPEQSRKGFNWPDDVMFKYWDQINDEAQKIVAS